MKHNPFSFASCLIVLALAPLTFTACSGDEELTEQSTEPPIDEILSKETTPITFKLKSGLNILFDFTPGGQFVKSDTFLIDSRYTKGEVTVNLRQGKHNLLWIWELYNFRQEELITPSYYHYAPIPGLVTMGDDVFFSTQILYAEKEMEVTPYLYPTQIVNYTTLGGNLQIVVTDSHANLNYPDVVNGSQSAEGIGRIKGLPYISSMSLPGKEYKREAMSLECNIYTWAYAYNSGYSRYIQPGELPKIEVSEVDILCPLNGLDNIQLTAEVYDKDGNSIPTITLPKFNLRRGYTTVLRGPLFSGSTSDWIVTMKPYEE